MGCLLSSVGVIRVVGDGGDVDDFFADLDSVGAAGLERAVSRSVGAGRLTDQAVTARERAAGRLARAVAHESHRAGVLESASSVRLGTAQRLADEAVAAREAAEVRLAQAIAREQRREALAAMVERDGERRADTRRMILTGAYTAYCLRKGLSLPTTTAGLMAALDQYLSRPGDRVLFGLAPKRPAPTDHIP